jgi:PAS domain S-box-containing protein
MGETGPAGRAAWEGEMFRLLAENVLDYALFVVAPDRHILSWSKGAERLLGFTADEIVGRRCDLFFTPEDVAAGVPQRELDEALATGRGDDDRWHVRRDGSRFWSSGVVTPLRGDGGTLRGFAKIMRDRTDLKRTQDAHDEALAYAEAVVATVREPLVVLDGGLRVRTANRSFYNTFRVRPDETEGRLLYDLGNGQWDIPALRTLLGNILPHNTEFNDFEVEHTFPAIGRKVMLLNARGVYREGNHAELILLAIEDVTALRDTERARREAEARFTEMVKNVRDHSIFLTNPAGVITSWNAAAERIIGYTEAEAVGRHFALIFTPEDVAAGVPAEELRQAREEGRAEDERWHRRKNGSLFWALGIVTPLHDPDGRLSGYSKILRDMTEWKRADEAGRDRQRQLELVTDHAPVLLYHADADLRFKFVNRPYAERLGLHPRDLVGRPIADALGGEAFARIEPHAREALAGRRVEFEADLPYRGIGTRTIRVAYEPERDGGGRVIGYVAAVLDITDRKQTEDALRASEERFARFMQHLPGLAWVKDGGGRYVYANDAAVAAFGTPRAGLYGKTDAEVFPPDTARQFRENDRQALAGGAGVRAVETLEHGDGVVRHSLVSKFPIPGPDGGPPLVGGVAIDITEEMRTRAVLEESEERFRATFDQAAVGIAHVGTDGRWLRVNRKLCDIVGYSHDELLRLTFQDITHPDDLAADLAQLRRLVAGEIVTYSMEKRYFRKDRRTVWINLTVALARTPWGEPKYLISVVEDITGKKAVEDALRDSERKYRTLFENMAEEVHYWRVERDGRGRVVSWRLVDANPPALKTWGKSLDDVRGRTTDEIFGPGSTEHYRAVVERVMAEGVPHAYEDYFPNLDRHFRFTTVPVGDHFITTGADITAIQKAHESLRRSEDRYRTVLESITDAFFALGRDWTFTYVNRQAETLLGRTPGDLPGRNLWDEYPGLAGSEFERAYRRVMAEQVTASVTAFYPDHARWYEVHVYPAEGGISVYFRDVSDRVRAEEALRASEERFRTLFERMDEGYCVIEMIFDPPGGDRAVDYRFVEVNPAFEAQSGMRDVTGRRMREFVADIEEHWLANYGRVALTGEPVRFANEYTGLNRWFEVYAFRVGGAGSHRVGVLFTDITRRKQAEADRERLVGQLRDADRRKDEFLATLAHELRNPLAPLRNAVQVMKLAAGDPAAVAKAREMMERQLGQMVHLIDDLMDVSRITRGKLQLRRERVDLASVVRGAVEVSRPGIEASAHRLAVALPPEPVFLDADPTRLTQVLSNLLTNAAKYTERGGHIQLTAARHGGEVVVSVSDTGIGIAPEHLPRLFEMFSQVSSALDRSQGGLGIGLALVRGLVEMHGGSVEARSGGLGRGSEFVVRLPAADGPATGQGPPPGGGTVPARTGRRVLVTDDNRDAADSLAVMLRLGGHEVHTAYDGHAAVEAAARLRPDVAVLDIGMPGMTGYEVARRIRSEPWGRAVVLVALTGWGQEEDKRRATEAGFDRHLTKPVDPAALDGLLAATPKAAKA